MAMLIQAMKADNEWERLEIAGECIQGLTIDGETIGKDEHGNWHLPAHLIEGVIEHVFNLNLGNGGGA